MGFERVTTAAWRLLRENCAPASVVVDLTAGNGNDTLFLCQHFKTVFAFDIQTEAIERTKARCAGYVNLTLIQDSHARIDDYIRTPVDAFIFNSGYLPGSESTQTTTTEGTLIALQKAIGLLKPGGWMFLTFYRKQAGGDDEFKAAEAFLHQQKTLRENGRVTYPNDPLAPVLLCFQKGQESGQVTAVDESIDGAVGNA